MRTKSLISKEAEEAVRVYLENGGQVTSCAPQEAYKLPKTYKYSITNMGRQRAIREGLSSVDPAFK